MTMITPSYLGETIEYSSLHACRSTLEDPTRTWNQSVFTFWVCATARIFKAVRHDITFTAAFVAILAQVPQFHFRCCWRLTSVLCWLGHGLASFNFSCRRGFPVPPRMSISQIRTGALRGQKSRLVGLCPAISPRVYLSQSLARSFGSVALRTSQRELIALLYSATARTF